LLAAAVAASQWVTFFLLPRAKSQSHKSMALRPGRGGGFQCFECQQWPFFEELLQQRDRFSHVFPSRCIENGVNRRCKSIQKRLSFIKRRLPFMSER
jgi:hypothetical protein